MSEVRRLCELKSFVLIALRLIIMSFVRFNVVFAIKINNDSNNYLIIFTDVENNSN